MRSFSGSAFAAGKGSSGDSSGRSAHASASAKRAISASVSCLKDGGGAALVAECVEAGAACAAWSAAAPVLGCGGSAAGRFDGGAAGGARRAVDLALGGAAADGREEVLLLVRLPHAARVQLDSCGSFADTRLRLYDGCPLTHDAAPLGVDGDSGQPRACRGGGGDGAAAVASHSRPNGSHASHTSKRAASAVPVRHAAREAHHPQCVCAVLVFAAAAALAARAGKRAGTVLV